MTTSEKASSASTASVIPKNSIQQVKDLIETHEFMRALKIIQALQSEYPHSAQLLVLEALVYETTSHSQTLAVCLEAKKLLLNTDASVLPDVLNTLHTIFERLGRNDLAISSYEYVREKVSDNFELMMGLCCCYIQESAYVNQLKISLKLYQLKQEPRFLLWAVFSMQLQVFYHLFNKQVDAYDFSEPEALVVYISVTEQQAKCDIAHEILFNLGSTLVVAEVCRRRLKGGRLLSHLCDYGAAAEVLGQKFESCNVLNGGSPGGWESIINNLGQLLEDDSKWCAATNDNQIHLPMFFVCELSQFTSEMSRIARSSPVYNKEYNSLPYQRKKYKLEEAVPEYFNRLGPNGGMSLRVLTNAEEGWVIENLLQGNSSTQITLKENFDKLGIFRIKESCGIIPLGLKSVYHGTTIALKTKNFIIVAADGKLTTNTSYNALNLKADKLRNLDDMCVAILGDWKSLSETIRTLRTCKRCFKENGVRKLTVSEWADFTTQKLFFHLTETQVIFCAFDQDEVPCISYASSFGNFDVKDLYFCEGTGSMYADAILSSYARFDMSFDMAVELVERALVYANMYDGCTGGWASIQVIYMDNTIKALAREHISTTLQRRHHSFVKSMKVLRDESFSKVEKEAYNQQ